MSRHLFFFSRYRNFTAEKNNQDEHHLQILKTFDMTTVRSKHVLTLPLIVISESAQKNNNCLPQLREEWVSNCFLLAAGQQLTFLSPHTTQSLRRRRRRQKFGPAMGLTRLERWERAEKLNLSPPADVYKILTEIDREGKWADCVWEKIV